MQEESIAEPVSSLQGGIIAYGIYHAPSFQWEALFLLFGLLTIIHGVFLWFKLYDSPAHCNFLTEEEKIIALERVRVGKTGSETWAFNKDQLYEVRESLRSGSGKADHSLSYSRR